MRKVLLWLSLLLLVGVGVELGSWVLYLAVRHKTYSYRETLHTLENLAGERGEAVDVAVGEGEEIFRGDKLALHPFLGFHLDPSRGNVLGVPINELGFPGPSPLVPRTAREYRIGLFGGSVAFGLWMMGREVLVRELEESGFFPGRELRCYCFAIGGFKQPQQLEALGYLESLGIDLDMVVNLDGFNEIVLPPAEVLPDSPAEYPRAWSDYTRHTLDPRKLRALGEVVALRSSRSRLASRILHSPLRYSVAAGVIWKAVDRSLSRRLAQSDARFTLASAAPSAASRAGKRYRGEQEMLEDLARIWAASSRAMYHEVTGAGREYYHFLQPNQYVEGSKPLTRTELRNAFRADYPYRPWAARGYPYLVAAGQELSRDGVPFFDLTRLFAGKHYEVYSDPCCHFTPPGNRAIARAMARRIVGWKQRSGQRG